MLYWLIAVFHLVVMSAAVLHALICKRDHRAALGWMGVIIIFPIAGPLLYFLFGINRVRTKAKSFTGRRIPALHFGYERSTRTDRPFHEPLLGHMPHPHLAEVGGRATRHPLIKSSHVTALYNGEAFFPRLIGALDDAENLAFVSSYLFAANGVAREVIDALCRAAERGVDTRVMIDGVGALYSFRRALRPLRRAGVKVALFAPPQLLPPTLDINLRNHRKIAVIDNRVGFFGGINVDHRHMVEAEDNRHPTEDVHFQARGPVVSALHELFGRDWHMVTGTEVPPPTPPEPSGNTRCRVIDDGPDDTLNHLAMTLNGVFAAARKRITIMMPYFLPSADMIAMLQAAVLRGVQVSVVLPERSNLPYVDWASRNMLWELVLWDVAVYYKPAPFAHTKLVIVDDHYVLAGSANLDARSLRLNFELGVEVFDDELALELQAHVQRAIAVSTPVTLESLDGRPLWQRIRDAAFWLFSSYL
ncbi:phospholipase D-like domain-containing protein [Marinimicrobium alkaliphilum]|uniref:phospholipase D-like domain-containing protein n=1 Tax=Marinimicrobium alkaliphilum TaxID=2202654 RepID=UPI000DBA8CAB|nr:phospholipase D-like domain-containing protein [Marinimicrobium alkaliphilum]